MKISLIVLFTLIISSSSFSQNFADLENIKLIKLADYENNEAQVLKCANYILASPIGSNDANKTYCTRFIIRWMTGCDITFELGEDFVNLTDGNTDLTSIYMAALVKAALVDGNDSISPEKINEEGRAYFLSYCENPENKVKKNKYIKKALKEGE